MTDWELLDRYTRTRCELAFGELVTRHAGFIHGTCRRVLRDAHRAQDVMQAVFVVLARRPPVQRAGASLAGWLYQTAIYACNNAMRSERRRIKHERHAIEEREREMAQSESSISTEVEAQLDDALASLSSSDRDVLLMRYYQDFDLRQIGAALGLSESAASKRATRALDRLRAALAHTGHTVPAGALCVLLRQPATGQLIHDAASAALTGNSGVVVESITQGVIKMMSNVKAKLVAAVAVTAIVVFGGAAISVPLVFAKATTMQSAAPATKPAQSTPPAKAPADASMDPSTPKGALRAFATATRGADYETLARVSKTSGVDDAEAKMIDASNAYQKSFGELSTAVREKFGDDEWRKFMRQRGAVPLEPFLRLIDAELDQHDVVIDGETAKVIDKRNPKVETGIKLVREDGVWKVVSTGLVAQFGEEKASQRTEMLQHRAQIVSEVAGDVAAGKYENIEAAGNGLRDALRR